MDFNILQKVYYDTAITSLSEDERKFYELVKAGKFKKDVLIVQSNISLLGLFPSIDFSGYSYYSTTYSADNLKTIKSLGFKVGLLTNVSHHVERDVSIQLYKFLGFDFQEPVPRFLGVAPIGNDILEFKKRCPQEIYKNFFKVTENYIESIREVTTILQEINTFLLRDEVNLDYLKKNFQELYKLYEDGR